MVEGSRSRHKLRLEVWWCRSVETALEAVVAIRQTWFARGESPVCWLGFFYWED